MIRHDIPEPALSPDFTIEDIRKIRTWNDERWKDATADEIIADIEQRAAEARSKMKAV